MLIVCVCLGHYECNTYVCVCVCEGKVIARWRLMITDILLLDTHDSEKGCRAGGRQKKGVRTMQEFSIFHSNYRWHVQCLLQTHCVCVGVCWDGEQDLLLQSHHALRANIKLP